MKNKDLSGTWSLNVVKNDSTPPEALALPPDIPVAIPGDIAAALLEASLIPDPYYGRNELDVLWLGRTEWSLSTDFTPGIADRSGDELSWIKFDCIDTIAELKLNGAVIAESRNMFRRLCPDVSSALISGVNHLEVIIRSPVDYTELAAEDLPYPVPHSAQFPWQWNHRNLLRKVACHGGWDWGITLMTGGIYESPILLTADTGRISYVTTELEPDMDGSSWNLNIRTEYESRDVGEILLSYSLEGRDTKAVFPLVSGENLLEHTISVESPELWWPAGQGDQRLYTLEVTAYGETVSKRIGFRTVEVVVEDDSVGRSMFFRVNGRDIYAKGANWIPVDAFPSRHTDEVYRRLLSDSVEANMNMIRLWGGGQYEKDIFYELCDELGLMIWHDMMFACSLYPVDEPFLAEADAEVRHQLKRLKDHPSIALWCGNNEDLGALTWFDESRDNRDRYIVDYDRLNENVVGRAVRELDPGRTWWPSSPSAGEGDYSDCWHDDTKGDMHYWSVWHEGLPFESYYDVLPRFCSEFGFQSFTCERTVEGFAPENQRNITSPVMRHHQKNNAGNSIILSTMARYFRMPASFADQLYLSQVQQAWAIRTAVDFWRANRPVSMGALYWQLNDNWPVASWASIEYDGTWKLLHYEARRFFAPMRISLYKKDAALQITGVNDSPTTETGTLSVRLMSFNGEVLEQIILDKQQCLPGSAVSFGSRLLSELSAPDARHWDGDLKPHDADEFDLVEEGFMDRFIVAEWTPDSGSATQVESLLLSSPRDCELAAATVIARPGSAPDSIKLETDFPAFYVLAEHNSRGRFSDAGFTLLPGSPVELQWLPSDGVDTPVDLAAGVTVRHLKSTY